MGRPSKGERAWARYRNGCWRLVTVQRDPVTGRVGRPVEIRLPGVTTREQAERIAGDAERKLKAGVLDRPVTWAEATEGFILYRRTQGDRESGLATYKTRLRAVGRVLGDPAPEAVAAPDASRYVELRAAMPGARHGTTVSGRTMAAEMAAETEKQRWMQARGWRPDVPWEGVARPDTEHGRSILLPHEIGPWLRAAQQLTEQPPGGARASDWARWYAAAWLQILGLRRGELRQILGRDVDLVGFRLRDGREVLVVYVRDRAGARTKTRESVRCLPVTIPDAVQALRAAFSAAAPDQPCFPGRKGKPLNRTTHWFIRRVQATCTAAGLTPVTGHELRHSFATAMRRSGVAYDDLAPWLGHRDARVTRESYVHSDPMELLGPALQMGDYLEGLVSGRPGMYAVPGGR